MHDLTRHAGEGMLKSARNSFGKVSYRLNILRDGAGGVISGDDGTIVRAWLCKEPVSLELATGECVNLDITQATFGEGTFLVEGIVDALAVAALGESAIAVGGTSISEEQMRELRNVAGSLYVLPDADEEGNKAARRWVRDLYPKALLCPAEYGEKELRSA